MSDATDNESGTAAEGPLNDDTAEYVKGEAPNGQAQPPVGDAKAGAPSAPDATPEETPAVADGAPAEEAAAGPPPERNTEAMSILEAALFASSEILTAQRLKMILPGQPDGRAVRTMVNTINAKLQRERHPFEIAEIGGGYQFRTVPYYHPWVQQVFKEKAARRLSIQALECLAIIAYRQPITRAEIESIRGVMSEGAMGTLLEKRLVTVTGRSERAGRPLLYGTTPAFLQYFGLAKLADLPRMEEFEAMAREKMDDLTDEELRKLEAMAGEEQAEGGAQAGAEAGDAPQAEGGVVGDGDAGEQSGNSGAQPT